MPTAANGAAPPITLSAAITASTVIRPKNGRTAHSEKHRVNIKCRCKGNCNDVFPHQPSPFPVMINTSSI